MSGNHHAPPWHGVPRGELCWWPIIESCACEGCGLCVTSCPTEALAFDYELRLPFVRDPHRRVVGCATCATLCPHEAILLPGREAIQHTIAQRRLADRARKELRIYRKWWEGVLPEPIDPGEVSQRRN